VPRPAVLLMFECGWTINPRCKRLDAEGLAMEIVRVFDAYQRRQGHR
jgi:hypothetical protein